jgi:S-methylmethionine-dependent homocysteine/selenocysteine methylase
MTVATPAGLLRQPFTVLDGGLSTALDLLGHRPSGPLWTATLLAEHPDVVTRAHALAVQAGAEVVISASYQASEAGFVAAGLSAAEARLVLASTTDVARRSGAALVAASVGPFGAVLADGSEYHGRYTASWAEVRAFHRARLQVLAGSGPDVFAVETMPARVEAEIVVEELASVTALPAWVTFTCRDEATTCAGDPMAEAVAAVDHPQVVAVGVNCTAPRHVTSLLRAAASAASGRPLVAYPNHGGRWDAAAGCWVGPGAGDVLAEAVSEWVALGARLVGGCCGVGPDEIAALARLRDSLAAG